MKDKLKLLKNLPKITKAYLVLTSVVFFSVIGFNLWLLFFTQFGSINLEVARVNILGKFIDKVATSYINQLDSKQSELTIDEFKSLIDVSLEEFIKDKGDPVVYTLNSDNFFNYQVLSNDSFRVCFGFLTDHNVRDKYKIVKKNGEFVNHNCCEEALDWIPRWVEITREGGEVKNSQYVDCYKVFLNTQNRYGIIENK